MSKTDDADLFDPRGAPALKQSWPVVATQRLDNIRTISDDEHGIFIDQRCGVTDRTSHRVHTVTFDRR